MSSPSWYDILGVAPDATPAEIKAAWRDATDKFEPGTGASQFRLFNEAADVLLDPQKRNAYDAELAGAEVAGAADATVLTEPVVTEPEPEPEVEAQAEPADEPAAEDADEADDTDDVDDTEPPAPTGSRRARLYAMATSTIALVVIGFLALGALVFAGVSIARSDLGGKAGEYKAAREAQAAAARSLNLVLSFDYRQLDTPAKVEATLDTVTATMTPDLAERYRKAFGAVCRPDIDSPATAVARKSIVTSQVEDPAVIDAGEDRVRLLVFVTQETRNASGGPRYKPSQVVATMVRKGDRWLLETIEPKSQTPPNCIDPNAATPSPSASPTP